MKFAMCSQGEKQLGLCLVDEMGVKPLSDIFSTPVRDLCALIEQWPSIRTEILNNASKATAIACDAVTFETPVKTPKRNILCIGKNYAEHARELQGQTASIAGLPTEPIFFSKMVFETIGPEEAITFSTAVTDEVDYEVELAIIIGKTIKDITPEEAEAAIFGYTIGNDVSARNLQIKHIQWHKGKSLDTFMPLGPVVVTRDEFEYPPKRKIECYVNDELRQSGVTDDLIFNLNTIVSTLSQGMTLIPGDVILTGTPSGVGMGFKPPKYLKNGDVIKCVIEGIGTLSNPVVTKN